MQNWYSYLRAGLARQNPEDKILGGKAGAGSIARLVHLRSYFERHWQTGVFGTSLILFSSLFAFAQPLIYRFLVDNVMLARRMDLLPAAILMLVGVKLFTMAAEAFERYFFTRFSQGVMLDLQENLLKHTLSLPKAFFDNTEIGYLISRLTSDVEGLRWFFSSNIAYLISSLFLFAGGLVFLFYLEWRLGLMALVVLPLLVVCVRYFSMRMRILNQHSMEQNGTVLERFQETLASIPLIKAFASEKRESERVISEVSVNQQIEIEQVTVNSAAVLAFKTVPGIAQAIVLVAGAYWVIRGEWSLGSLLAFQSYLGYVYGPALSLADANIEFQHAMIALERVTAVLEVVPEENSEVGKAVEHLSGDIRFENVSFSYGSDEQILKDVSFHVMPGETIAIAGPSGVGKTTLISLLIRFYRPTHGEIRFDNLPADEYELNSLRQRIGYVSQSSLLLAGSIGDNLRYGNPFATQTDIEQAATTAGIQDFIAGLPDGYETLVNERGVNLSDGQKQRLSIARALIKSPDILILDEPTSALDSLVEKSILDALPEQISGKSCFIISHRPSTIRRADRILVLGKNGSVVIGTHRELLADNQYYASLFQ